MDMVQTLFLRMIAAIIRHWNILCQMMKIRCIIIILANMVLSVPMNIIRVLKIQLIIESEKISLNRLKAKQA